MPRFLVATCVVAIALIASAQAGDTKGPSTFQQFIAETPLPQELAANGDAFPMARMSTFRHPLTFKPYSVTRFHQGWMPTKSTGFGAPLPGTRSSTMGESWTSGARKFSFVMNEGDQALWNCNCAWHGSEKRLKYRGKTSEAALTEAGSSMLRCSFARPGAEPEWVLDFHLEMNREGLGMDINHVGRLTGNDREFRVKLLLAVNDSRVIGDIPGGYLFLDQDTPVAALQTRATAPVRFTISRSLSADQRPLFAAATAALVLRDRMGDLND